MQEAAVMVGKMAQQSLVSQTQAAVVVALTILQMEMREQAAAAL